MANSLTQAQLDEALRRIKFLEERISNLEHPQPKSFAMGMPKIIEEPPRPKYPCSKIGCKVPLNSVPGRSSSTALVAPIKVAGFIDYSIDPEHNSYFRFCGPDHYQEWAAKRGH